MKQRAHEVLHRFIWLEARDEPEVKLSEADLRRMIQCLRDGAEYVQQSR